MKHVLNIALMAIVVLGLAMLDATNWCYAVLAIPAVIWSKSVLNLLHKLPVLAAAFWILVAVFAWQAALVGAIFYGVLVALNEPVQKQRKGGRRKSKKNSPCMSGTFEYDYETGELLGC
ncbi:MAG: hypothetical protein HWE24_14160 [Oceanospirillaceae bacterium]|nr:hypothetical protein [Oceanospirillaceae bacterium]